MLSLFQLCLAVFAIYGALKFSEEIRLLVPLGCLIVMFIVTRIDKRSSEEHKARRDFLQTRMEEMLEKEGTSIKDQNFFTIDSLLWPKSELIFVDAVQFILRDLKFRVSTGVHYRSVDRIVRIPETPMAFGLEILICEKDLERTHPKIERALQFEQEKKEGEKTLVIASTHIHLQLSEREKVQHVSRELASFLARNHVTFMTAYHLYQLWQKAKGGEVDIFRIFKTIYSHPGGIFPPKAMRNSLSLSFDLPEQLTPAE